MEYIQIGQFLQKFEVVLSDDKAKKILVQKILKNNINFDIDLNNIKIKDGVVSILGSGTLKNEIFLKKEKIEKMINEGTSNLRSIR